MCRLTVSLVSRQLSTNRNYKTQIVKLIMMFTAVALKWDVTSNTHNPQCKSFHQDIWDISWLLTHFSLLFQALGSYSHIFCLFRDWQVCCAYGTHVDNTNQVPVFIKRTSILQEVQFKMSDLLLLRIMQLSATIPEGRPQGHWHGAGFVDIREVWSPDRVLDCLYTFVVGSPGKTHWRNWNSPSREGKMYYESYKNIVHFNSMTDKITWTSSCAVYRCTLFVFFFNQPFINFNSIKESFL